MILRHVYMVLVAVSVVRADKLCGIGGKQSPIDIDESEGIKFIDGTVNLQYYDVVISLSVDSSYKNITVTNLKNISISATTSDSGTDSSSVYIFHHMHFHIGCSEHTVKNNSYPFELHLVHYNSTHESYDVAKTKANGLLVVAILTEQVAEDNVAICHVWETLHNTTYELKNITLMEFLPSGWNQYYVYEGSLTTDDCDESVTWMIVKQTIKISEKQLHKLREETNDTCKSTEPLNKRSVYSVQFGSDGSVCRSCRLLILLWIVFLIGNFHRI